MLIQLAYSIVYWAIIDHRPIHLKGNRMMAEMHNLDKQYMIKQPLSYTVDSAIKSSTKCISDLSTSFQKVAT